MYHILHILFIMYPVFILLCIIAKEQLIVYNEVVQKTYFSN